MTRACRMRFGLFAALLALAGQLAWGAVVPQPVLELLASGAICHSDASGRAPGRAPKHIPIRAVSPACLALAMPTPPPVAPTLPPAPRTLTLRAVVQLPPATAPPAMFPLAAAPRGPPSVA